MKNQILVYIFDGYADWEPAYACAELNAPTAKYSVKTISHDLEPKTSMGGFRVLPDYSVHEFPREFSMLILAGGFAWMEQENDDVLPVVQYSVQHHIPVAAICNAANFMAEHGYLDQVKHTGNTLDFMRSQAPHYKGERNFIERQAMSDNGMITANGSSALEFAREILMLLKVRPEEEIQRWYMENKQGFYPA